MRSYHFIANHVDQPTMCLTLFLEKKLFCLIFCPGQIQTRYTNNCKSNICSSILSRYFWRNIYYIYITIYVSVRNEPQSLEHRNFRKSNIIHIVCAVCIEDDINRYCFVTPFRCVGFYFSFVFHLFFTFVLGMLTRMRPTVRPIVPLNQF